MAQNHRCSHPTCPAQIGTHLFMCRVHWRQVPRPLQTRIVATWNALHSGGGRELIAEYRAATREAIALLQAEPAETTDA